MQWETSFTIDMYVGWILLAGKPITLEHDWNKVRRTWFQMKHMWAANDTVSSLRWWRQAPGLEVPRESYVSSNWRSESPWCIRRKKHRRTHPARRRTSERQRGQMLPQLLQLHSNSRDLTDRGYFQSPSCTEPISRPNWNSSGKWESHQCAQAAQAQNWLLSTVILRWFVRWITLRAKMLSNLIPRSPKIEFESLN